MTFCKSNRTAAQHHSVLNRSVRKCTTRYWSDRWVYETGHEYHNRGFYRLCVL